MLRRRIKSLIGLDIGSRAIKAVELTREGHGFVMTGYGQTDVLSEEQRPDAILQVLRENSFHTKRVVTAVYGKSVIVRYLSMTRMPEEDLKNAIRYEADKYIPFDVEEVIMDSQALPDDRVGEGAENEMRVLLVAVKRALIDDHYRLLTSLGLQPTIIDVDSFAVGNAFELARGGSFYEEDADRAIALLDIGANKTNINIFFGGTSYFTREIYLAGDDFTHAIAKRLGLDIDTAEARKRDPGEHPEEVLEAVMPSFDDLANEILLSFDYFENQFDREVEEVFMSGGGSRMAGMEDMAVEFVNAGRRVRAVRFTPDGGSPGYYDERGTSMKRFFLASPLKFQPVVTSGFSKSRLHPVLREYRAHLGVDYRAPSGAPVVAVSDGVVLSAGMAGASGRLVHLRHANGFESEYLHLSAVSVRAGERVQQGDVIGRVGSSGLATGPHLDYRLKKNGSFVNPVTAHRAMPPADPVPADQMKAFAAARDAAFTELGIQH